MAADPVFDDVEIDKILNQEASLATREAEVMRVLGAFRLNAYDMLDLDFMPGADVTDDSIHKTYRRKSLLIHPDKLKHPRGIEAFDLLKKAEGELLDGEHRKKLDQDIQDARMLVLRSIGLAPSVPDDHEKILAMPPPGLKERTKQKLKEILIEEELRKRRVRKMTMIAEGAEAKRQEDEIERRKRKVEDDKKWEDSREERVNDWRSFQKGPKKKKAKTNVLG